MAAKKKKKTSKPITKAKSKAKAKAKPKVKPIAKKAKAKSKVAPKKAKAKAKPAKKKGPVSRRDGTGHLNPTYAKQLHAMSGKTNKGDSKRTAFSVKKDAYAEELGSEVVGKATTGEDQGEDAEDAVEEEESGGPFVETTGRTEFADGIDESNPEDAEREPFPTT